MVIVHVGFREGIHSAKWMVLDAWASNVHLVLSFLCEGRAKQTSPSGGFENVFVFNHKFYNVERIVCIYYISLVNLHHNLT